MPDSYAVPDAWRTSSKVDAQGYAQTYARSLEESEAFWLEQAELLDWIRKPSLADRSSFQKTDFGIRWFEDGILNVSANCIDRHLAEHSAQTALIWEPDDPAAPAKQFTYAEVHREVCRFANVLKAVGVKRGDPVTLYLPMIPETMFAMLACARIGAVHAVVFAGFSPEALAARIEDCRSEVVITADGGLRGGKRIALKANVDAAATLAPGLRTIVTVKATGEPVAMQAGRDHWYHERAAEVGDFCEPEPIGAKDPLFILYTSGSTGKPKGVVHGSGGYLLWAQLTFETAFDHRPGDVWWCTADIGWITGHSYAVYGPLLSGATSVMFEGVPSWPTPSRFWQVVDRHQVSHVYTAPTALRALMREGDGPVRSTSRASLRLLGTAGEPINPEAWRWYHDVIGDGRCPIIDTWWQTETGGLMIAPLPGAMALKPGSATRPFFGVEPVLLDAEGSHLDGPAEGNLCLARSWPGQARTLCGDHDRFFQTYFSTFPGYYFTGDGCRRDEDGDYWITGRVDDVLNVSGHRLGTAELESAFASHAAVAEAAVVGYPHDIKGQGICAFITLSTGQSPSDALHAELVAWVRQAIGPVATPDIVQFAPGLPKTRSGKIMRRILRKIAEQDFSSLGDVSTLMDPSVVDDLVAQARREMAR